MVQLIVVTCLNVWFVPDVVFGLEGIYDFWGNRSIRSISIEK